MNQNYIYYQMLITAPFGKGSSTWDKCEGRETHCTCVVLYCTFIVWTSSSKCLILSDQKYFRLLKNKRPTWCHLLFYFISYVLSMFRTLVYPSSVACDYSIELPHCSYCSWFDVCWSFGVVGLQWYPCCSLKHCFILSACNSEMRQRRPVAE